MNACYASCQYFWMKRTTNNQMTNVLSHKGCVVRGFCLEVHNGCYFDYRCIHLKWPLIISNIHARMNSILETPKIKLLVDILHISLVKSMDMYFFINQVVLLTMNLCNWFSTIFQLNFAWYLQMKISDIFQSIGYNTRAY